MKLIPKTPELLNKIYEWNMDSRMRKCLGFPSVPMDYSSCINYFDIKYDGNSCILIGVQGDSGNIHGCYMVDIDEMNRRAKVHFAFDEPGRGKLLMKSVKAFYDYMFFERRIDSLYGEISTSNCISYKCAKNMGWEDVCTLPEYFNEQGQMVDAYLIRLTNKLRKV